LVNEYAGKICSVGSLTGRSSFISFAETQRE